MTEAANDLMFETPKKMRADPADVKAGQADIGQKLVSVRGHTLSVRTGIHDILARHDDRLDRIEKRLELRKLAETRRNDDPEK